MTTLMDTQGTIVHNETIQYLQEENVILNDKQIKFINEISLTLQDLCNMSIESDFAEFCDELNLSFGSKIKLKSAIIKLQEQKQQKLISSQNTFKLDVLISMGFDQQKAQIALTMNDNDITKAAQLLTAPQLQPLCNKDEKKDIEMDEAKVEDPNLQTLMAMGFNKQNSMIALELNRNDISKATETLTSGSISTFVSEQTTSNTECKYVEKITVALIGNSGVGKSSILTRFMDGTFDEQRVETLGVDHREKEMNIIDTNIKLRVLDTAGQERFASIASWYYRVSHAFIVVYDITDKESFLHLDVWMNKLNEKACDLAKRFVVGTKIDLQSQRVISFEAAKKYAEAKNFRYCEVSAKSGRNINQLFTTVALYVLRDNLVSKFEQNNKSKNTIHLIPMKNDQYRINPTDVSPHKLMKDAHKLMKDDLFRIMPEDGFGSEKPHIVPSKHKSKCC